MSLDSVAKHGPALKAMLLGGASYGMNSKHTLRPNTLSGFNGRGNKNKHTALT